MADTVSFYYFSKKPHLHIHDSFDVETVPMIGDTVHLPGESFVGVSKNLKGRKLIKAFGAGFRVISRLRYFHSSTTFPMDGRQRSDWRIGIEPIDKFEDEK